MGAQAAILALGVSRVVPQPIAPSGRMVPSRLARFARVGISPHVRAGAFETNDTEKEGSGGAAEYRYQPQVELGVSSRIGQEVSLDVGGRYLPIFAADGTYHAFSVLASITSPF